MMFGIPAERLLPWADFVYVCAIGLAGFFIVIGLCAGYVQNRLQVRIIDGHRQLLARSETDAEVELLRAETEGKAAEQRAAEAQERAARLELSANEAGRLLDETKLLLEQERVSRVQLISGLASRHIAPEKILDIRLAIMGRIPKIVFSYLHGDRETLPFAQEVRSTIVGTGAALVERTPAPNLAVPPGLVITIPDEKFEFLPEAFEGAGVTVQKVVAPGRDVEISVGAKPGPF